MITSLRVATAMVWFVFGIGFKLLDLVPRHTTIVAAVVGEAAARPVTLLVGAGETVLGVWILTGAWPRLCMSVQTLAIVAMNTLELLLAREHLLAPVPMVLANAVFLTVGWYCALRSPQPRRPD